MSTLTSAATAVGAVATWSDEALANALARDDEKAFAEIYDRYWQRLHQLAVRKLGRAEDAEEVVQDLFATLWNNRQTADVQHLNGYLFSALKYRIIDCIRAQMVRKAYAATGRDQRAAPCRCTEESVAAADLSLALHASVLSLPGPAREVFRLSRVEHRSVPEIAAHLQVSPKTVEYHLSRSLRLLRRYLKDFLLLAVVLTQAAG